MEIYSIRGPLNLSVDKICCVKNEILGHFALWGIFGLCVLGHFVLKNQEKKTDKIHRDFSTISSLDA